MKDSVLDRISQKPIQILQDDTIMKHDIKILELDLRLRSLENLVNEMHNKVAPVWWGKE